MTPAFKQALEQGQIGESRIARWLHKQGCIVLPAYQIELDHNKGPRLFIPTEGGAADQIVAPDLFVFSPLRGPRWVEAKTKKAFTWHRVTECWTTGIDLRHYGEYCRVADMLPYPVFLLFLQLGGVANDPPAHSPDSSPAGLFGGNLAKLRQKVHHTSPQQGPSGMVHWQLETLTKFASLSEL